MRRHRPFPDHRQGNITAAGIVRREAATDQDSDPTQAIL